MGFAHRYGLFGWVGWLGLGIGACASDASSLDTVDATAEVSSDPDTVAEVTSDAAANDIDEVSGDVSVIADPRVAWRLFETALPLPVPAGNPFDPAEIAVDVDFTGPDGAQYTLPAFVYQGFSRSLGDGDDAREKLVAEGEPEWRVRFRPPFGSPPGTWTWRWRVKDADGERVGEPATFEAVEDPSGRGLVRISAVNPRQLAFEDGTSYFAIGENMAWYDRRGTFAYDAWLAEAAAAGANYARLWMPSWAFGLEWTERDQDGQLVAPSRGNYRSRLDRAWQLDHVFDRAETLGIQLMLCLQNHGPFSTIHAGQWDSNPWNAAFGGPLAEPTDVFTDATARELFRRRLRYIVARWGHAANLFAWELWNEVDLVADANGPDVKAWTVEMARELKRLDPWQHLVTTSISGFEAYLAWTNDDVPYLAERFDFWALPEIELTQLHFYGIGDKALDFSVDLGRVAAHLAGFGKPMLIAEAGVNPDGPNETLEADPDGVAFHDSLWAGLFAGGVGTGMSWWWDSIIHPRGWYLQFQAVAEAVAGVDFAREDFVGSGAEVVFGSVDLRVQRLQGATVELAWVKNRADQWHAPDTSVISGYAYDAGEHPAGRFEVSIIPTWTNDPPVRSMIEHPGGPLTLAVPSFQRDVVVRITVAARP
jgi:hypothetical protein